jgi:putative FmdB family regulatory protein
MPNYDFTCIPCDRTIEIHRAYNDTSGVVCEVCGGFMIKAFSAPGIHFKGGGWGGSK